MLLHIYFFQVSEAGSPTLREVVFQEAVDSNKKNKGGSHVSDWLPAPYALGISGKGYRTE